MSATEQPALLGGPKSVPVDEHHPWPEITKEDREAIERVLDRGVFAGPNCPEVTALQEEFAAYTGVEYCVATNGGTTALHCALAAVGVEPGGEVIVPAYTFVASALSVLHQGADVVFCDVDPRTYNLDPSLLEERITDRTQAIVAVHIHGQMADMDAIGAIAERHGIHVVEDTSQSPGIRYKGRMSGSIGEAAGGSINQSKPFSAGEGGLFTTDDERYFVTARRMVTYGEDVLPGEPRFYWSHGIGFNYRNQELSSALARSQLRRLDAFNARAQENSERLTAGLERIHGLVPPFVHDWSGCSYWKYALQVQPEEVGWEGDPRDLRDRVLQALWAEGVEASTWQPQPVPAQPVFRRRLQVWHSKTDREPLRPWRPEELPVASRLCDVTFHLGTVERPLCVQEPELMDRYVEAVEKVMANLDAVLAASVPPLRRMMP